MLICLPRPIFSKFYKVRIALLLCCFLLHNAYAQDLEKELFLTGKVADTAGQGISNVSVSLKNATKNTTGSDNQGIYRIACKAGKNILIFKHLSYVTAEIEVNIAPNSASTVPYNVKMTKKITALDEVLVTSTPLSTTNTFETLKKQHKLIAGSTSIVAMTPEVQRLETIKDALKYEPGVVIQEFFGANDQPRLSIRGSGIQSNPQRRGIYLLQDGIPVNFADGSFIIGVMDPAISESVEVFKGANALRYGAATLGGALNFNSRTGRHAAGLQVKAEGGSFNYAQGNLMLGKNWAQSDAFLSVSGSRQDGFREHNKNRKLNITGNFGYRFSKNIDNRSYINYSYINFDIPGPLTMEMLKKDPTQINKGIFLPYYMGPNVFRDRPGREASVWRFANRTAFRLSQNTNLIVSAYYQLINDRFVFPIVLSTQRATGNDAGISLQLVQQINNGTITAGYLVNQGHIDRRGHINVNGLDSYLFSKDKLFALNRTFYVEYHQRFSDRLHVIGNLQLANNKRNSADVFPNPELRPWYSHATHRYRYFHSHSQSMNQQFSAFNPRIGALYHAGKNKDIQFFANFSSSYEPPTFDELVGTKVTANINNSPKEFFAIKLEKQASYTAEIGTRHEGTRYGWNIALYRSWIKNELLEVKDFVLGVKKTMNYPKTIHQGLELGAMGIPVEGIFTTKDKILVKAMYTYSDFYFNSGAYQGKQLAGVPPHYLTASVEYSNPGKFFIALNTESQPDKSPIDHTNTVYQPAFTLFGLRVGTNGWKHISFYIEAKNILNKYYASSYIISDQILLPPIPFPEFTVDNVAFFMPGQTRTVYAGINYKF